MVVLLLLCVGAAALFCGARYLTKEQHDIQKYEQARHARAAFDTSGSTDDAFLDSLGAVAWLKVNNTSIDYPVAQAQNNDPLFYLSHDLWEEENVAGCLFIDARTSINNAHILIYGHRMGWTGGMFSELRTCHKQDDFDKLGNLLLTTTDGTKTYEPLCALEVDMTYQEIQNFDHANTKELQTWLKSILASSSAASTNANELCSIATQAVTLVTCSQLRSGQRGRSVVVFAS